MKRICFFWAALFGVWMMFSCRGEQKPGSVNVPAEEGPQMELSVNDTVTVRQLATDFLELLKEGNVDEAVSRLFVLEGEEVHPFPEDQRAQCRFTLSMFPVYDYSIVDMQFNRETDSEVKYELVIQDPLTTETPATMQGMICPVRRDGVWYITLANTTPESMDSLVQN